MMDAFLARYWTSLDPRVRTALDRALDGGEVTVDDGLALAETTGRELSALTLVADELRARQAGDVVTYVVNRNINFTNVCIKHCTFCAFSRDHREEEGYFLPLEEVIRRAREARDLDNRSCQWSGVLWFHNSRLGHPSHGNGYRTG